MLRNIIQVISLVLLVVAGFLLLVPHLLLVGWILWVIGLLILLLCQVKFRKHLLLIYLSVAILGLIPINTNIALSHIVIMGLSLVVTIVGPYLVSKYLYKEKIIKYPLTNGYWHWWHYGYILLTALLGYLILPFWMQHTGDYMNWAFTDSPRSLITLFLGTNALGIWDEVFFVITCLALFSKHISFKWANLVQATLWTSFLFDLGFRSWIPALIFPFALLQGLVFKRTHSLLYILAIHLSLDFTLYLALINAHYPHLINIFVTR